MRLLTILLCLLIEQALLFSQPRLEMAGGPAFDYGELYETSPVTHQCVIRSTGSDTLHIWNIQPSCGCTAALLSSDRVLPGDSAILSITFNPERYTGKVERIVSLESNDTTQRRVHIKFSATIVRLLTIDPEYLVFRTRVDSPRVEMLSFSNTGPDPIRIVSVRSPSGRMTFKYPDGPVAPGQHVDIACTFAPSVDGTDKGEFTIVTDSKKLSPRNVRFFALVRPLPQAADK